MYRIRGLHHVLLLYLSSLIAQAMCQSGLTETEKQAILDEHNKLRGRVNPTASNMERMVGLAEDSKGMIITFGRLQIL